MRTTMEWVRFRLCVRESLGISVKKVGIIRLSFTKDFVSTRQSINVEVQFAQLAQNQQYRLSCCKTS
jgi:hypothetical protein